MLLTNDVFDTFDRKRYDIYMIYIYIYMYIYFRGHKSFTGLTGNFIFSCPRISHNGGDSLPPLSLLVPYTVIILESCQGEGLNWETIMSRCTSLSDGCAPNRSMFSSLA